MNRLRHQAFHLPALAVLLSWVLATLTRIGLTAFAWPDLDRSPAALVSIFAHGALGDLLFGLAFGGLILVFTAFTHSKWPNAWPFRAKRGIAVFALSGLLLLVAVAEFVFWNEFDARFNFVAVDYLLYTHEVVGNIRESYPLPLLLGGTLMVAALTTALAFRHWPMAPGKCFGIVQRIGLALVGAGLFWFVGGWSVDYASQPISPDLENQELAHNGPASLFLAFSENSLSFKRYYRTLPNPAYAASAPRWPDPARDRPSTTPLNPRHIVVIQVESLSASFLGAYGNDAGITPHLDQLVKEGVWFSNLYATGTRTVRGLEAMSAALPPLPGESIIRRSGNQDLYTLGSMLRRKSFQPMFVYGGYAGFDNMDDYFSGNGYKVLDSRSFSEQDKAFRTVWGVADELLFNEVLLQLDKDTRDGVKRFVHVMTTSNHRPYAYPDGRIDLPSKSGRDGAVKYTDWAIHNFLDQARKRPWFDDTLFVIVADHDASVAGRISLPPNLYRIPALFYAPKMLPPRRVDTMASQIDLPPTLLALLGIKTNGVLFGENLLAGDPDQRAFLVNYQELGYLTPTPDGLRHLTLLGPKQRVENYSVAADGNLARTPDDVETTNRAIALFQRAEEVYESGRYRQH